MIQKNNVIYIILFIFLIIINISVFSYVTKAENNFDSSNDTEFSYYTDECPGKMNNLPLLEQSAEKYNENKGSYLKCIYSETDVKTTNNGIVFIQYDFVKTFELSINTFLNKSDSFSFFQREKAKVKDPKISSVNLDEKIGYEGEYFDNNDLFNPHKFRAFYEHNDNSIIIAKSDYHVVPNRSYLLDPLADQGLVAPEVEKLKNSIKLPPYPGEDDYKLVKDIVDNKNKELIIKDNYQKHLKQWEKDNESKETTMEDRNTFISRMLCLLFDNLGLNLDWLRSFNIKEPFNTCGYIIYEDESLGLINRVANWEWNDFLQNYDDKENVCVNDDVMATFIPYNRSWLDRDIHWQLDDIQICKDKCIFENDGAKCE